MCVIQRRLSKKFGGRMMKNIITKSSVSISYACPETCKNTTSFVKDYAFCKVVGIFYVLVDCRMCGKEHGVKLVESEHWKI